MILLCALVKEWMRPPGPGVGVARADAKILLNVDNWKQLRTPPIGATARARV